MPRTLSLKRIAGIAFALFIGIGAFGPATANDSAVTTRLPTSIQPNGQSDWPEISSDGRFVVFQSWATNLTEINGLGTDIFLVDRASGSITNASVAMGGVGANGSSSWPSVSGNGRFVAFSSTASNLVTNDSNKMSDVFVRDMLLGTTTRVSVSSTGEEAFNTGKRYQSGSRGAYLSENGRYVVFHSDAPNLVANDTNGAGDYPFYGTDVFLHDLETKTTERVSMTDSGEEAFAQSWVSDISADGRYVLFWTGWAMVDDDTNWGTDVFARDRQTGRTIRLSVGTGGKQARCCSYYGTISADGRYAAFNSSASDLVDQDLNESVDVFIRDLASNETTMISGSFEHRHSDGIIPPTKQYPRDPAGIVGGYYVGGSWRPNITNNGRYVAFESAQPLVLEDFNGTWDIYVFDTVSGEMYRASVGPDVQEAEWWDRSFHASISEDGRYVVFDSEAPFVADDTNGAIDVFLRDRGMGCGTGWHEEGLVAYEVHHQAEPWLGESAHQLSCDTLAPRGL